MRSTKSSEGGSLYQPDRARKQMLKLMGRAANLLSQDIQFGCQLLEQAPDFAGDSNRYAARLLYRMLLGTLDGVDNLLTSGSGHEARVLLRKAIELVAQLQYLALRSENALLGTAFMREVIDEFTVEQGANVPEWPRLFQQAEAEIRRVRERAGKRIVRWYSIQGGPAGIRQLVKATEQPLLLEVWDDLSHSVHGSRTLEPLEQRATELERRVQTPGLMLGPLRTSAQLNWRQLANRADMLWALGTMAVVLWEQGAAERMFLFNRNTRLRLLQPLFEPGVDVSELDLICALERELHGPAERP